LNKVLGIALVVFGVALAVVPSFVDCASQGHFMTVMGKQLPMVCHWSAKSEIAMGVPLALVGGMFTITKRKSGFLMLSILGIALGGLAILLPAGIIGTCPTPAMTCNTVMKPTISILGSLSIVGGLVGLMLMRKADQ
jgi:hypothetical protein